jgi:hypothetical protein
MPNLSNIHPHHHHQQQSSSNHHQHQPQQHQHNSQTQHQHINVNADGYSPELDSSQNPHYYNSNNVLYDLFLERMRRAGREIPYNLQA